MNKILKYTVKKRDVTPNCIKYLYFINGELVNSIEVFFGKPMYNSPNNFTPHFKPIEKV